jgi:hypothetical protein
MCGAPERRCAHFPMCYRNNNGSQSTVGKTVELRLVVYHVAEPRKWLKSSLLEMVCLCV